MNSWKMNSNAGHILRDAIAISLEVHQSQVYKEIVDIDLKGIVSTRNGKTYKIRLVEIK
jgi:hypothetical protein